MHYNNRSKIIVCTYCKMKHFILLITIDNKKLYILIKYLENECIARYGTRGINFNY